MLVGLLWCRQISCAPICGAGYATQDASSAAICLAVKQCGAAGVAAAGEGDWWCCCAVMGLRILYTQQQWVACAAMPIYRCCAQCLKFSVQSMEVIVAGRFPWVGPGSLRCAPCVFVRAWQSMRGCASRPRVCVSHPCVSPLLPYVCVYTRLLSPCRGHICATLGGRARLRTSREHVHEWA